MTLSLLAISARPYSSRIACAFWYKTQLLARFSICWGVEIIPHDSKLSLVTVIRDYVGEKYFWISVCNYSLVKVD